MNGEPMPTSLVAGTNRLASAALPALAATMVVALPSFWSMMQLCSWWSPPIDAIVFAVMLAIALPRAMRRIPRTLLPGASIALVAGAAAAVGCGMLLNFDDGRRIAGAVGFAALAAASVWVRRFGRAWSSAGTIAALPLLAILVHPLPIEASWRFLEWMLIATGVALVWAIGAHLLAATPPLPATPPVAAGSARLASSTRMALQLGVAAVAAFAVGQWIDSDHLVWPVLTVLVVHSTNRGRGDVLWKGTQRIVGALAGTAIATLLAGTLNPGDNRAIVLIFAILALAAALREIGYVFWAACITAALAFL